jgi:uncharacterized membrane protein YhhN
MTAAVFASFLWDWCAVAFNWRKLKPITKILAMVMVILWTLFNVSWSPDRFVLLLILAQVFGLIGDIFLLLPGRWFLGGLGAFLIGHLFYIALIVINLVSSTAINLSLNAHNKMISITSVLWGMLLWVIYQVFKRDYFTGRHHGKVLWFLVQVYIWVLSGLMVMSLFRALIQPAEDVKIWLLAFGGVLFLVSDLILAYNRFVKPVRQAQLWVHISYHLAQISLAAGVLSIFGHI